MPAGDHARASVELPLPPVTPGSERDNPVISVHCTVMTTGARRFALVFTVSLPHGTDTEDVHRQACREWDRVCAEHPHTGRVRVPRPLEQRPDPQAKGRVLHVYEGVLWD